MASNNAASTPGRVTRQRSKTPLPAVSARQSNAYGARGKAELRSQVRSGGDNLLAALATGRGAPARRESAAPPPPASESSLSEEPEDEEEEDEEPDLPAAPTALDAGAAYLGAPAPNHQPEIEPRRLSLSTIFFWSLVVLLFLLGLFSGMALTVVPLPLRGLVARHNVLSGFRMLFHAEPFDIPPADLMKAWFHFQHDKLFRHQLPDHNVPDLQWSINLNFLNRIESLESRVSALEGNMTLTQETMAEMRRIIPEHVLLRQIDDHYEIPEEFWLALQERMVENSELAPLWRAWLLRNERQIQSLQQEQLRAIFDDELQKAHIVTREVFMQAIKENNDWLATEYSQELKKMWHQNMANMKAMASNSAKEVMERSELSHFTKAQLDILTKANALHNSAEALRSYNFFSVGGGARIDPKITSPTASKKQKSKGASTWRSFNPLPRPANAPIEALMRWDEVTECWCGTSKWEGGPVNIGVSLAHTIYPERLIVEHIPALATLEISAAPRELEIWASAGSAAQAEEYDRIMNGNAQPGLVPLCGPKPEPSFVCIGTGTYDIHQHNYVQAFRAQASAEDMGLATDKIVIRFNSNWGSNHTCIYRLRMTGTKIDEESEY